MYQVMPIDPWLFKFTDIAGTHCFLVVGKERAALLDTGVGCGSLCEQVSKITTLPVYVLLTHGHVDHAMGAGEFQDVRMNPLDEALYRAHSSAEVRLSYVRSCAKGRNAPQILEQLRPIKPFEQLCPLSVGDVFDLGGITVEIHEGAGHTPGCVTMLIPELRTLLLGDACNPFTFLFDESCSTVEEYREMLLRLDRATRGRYNRVLLCHGPSCLAPVELLNNVVAVCDDILAGNTDDVPFRGFHGESALIAKAMDLAVFSRVDGEIGNVVYNPERIR